MDSQRRYVKELESYIATVKGKKKKLANITLEDQMLMNDDEFEVYFIHLFSIGFLQ